MSTKEITGEIDRVSHWITHDYHTKKEEIVFYIRTEWRGTPARAVLTADRYEHSSGWSEWRVRCSEAREAMTEGLGASLTDTARTRMRERFEPMVRDWLDSTEYPASRGRSLTAMLRNKLLDAKPYGDPPTREVRGVLEAVGGEMSPEDVAYVTQTADAYDTFVKVLRQSD